MRKALLLFVIGFIPNVAFSACTPPSQWGDGYEYSECQFLAQPSVTGGVKSFWGNPKLTDSVLDSSGSGIGDFILTSGVHCGTCGYKDDGVTPRFENKSNDAFGNYDSLGYDCPSNYPKKDDEAILAYVATDVSEHGAEFCLTQFAAASHSKERFIYHQVARMSTANRNGLKCAWYCEPGWDGDRCMTRGLGGTVQEDISYTFNNRVISTLDDVQKNYADKTFCKYLGTSNTSLGNYCLAAIEKTDAAIGRTAVLDYKKIKNNDVWYQQQIVVGATKFMAHGIKAKPIWMGASGTHHPCGGSDDYTRISAKEIGGKERVLCLRGYTLNDDCEASTAETMKNIRYCNGWRAMEGIQLKGQAHFENSNAYYIKLSDDGSGACKEIRCTNGMSFHAGDNFSCSSCGEKAGLQGLCYGTTNCKWCGYGKCLNKTTCKCDSCAAIVTQEEMKIGPKKMDQCWRLIDADDFRACVTGLSSGDGQSSAD